MIEGLKEQCALKKASVFGQEKWKKTNKLTLPKESSRYRRELYQRTRFKGPKKKHVNREEESSSEENFSTCNDVPFAINERLKCIGCNKRRPSFSDSESVLDIVKMPVGTMNSILKSSFSLTSLRSCTPTDTPEHGSPLKLKTERQYHSLTKNNRKSSEQDKLLWRKSWGSGISQDGKEFWEGFQADYDYLMAQNILERDTSEVSLENASGSTPTAPLVWSHSEFTDYFAQLYSWLRRIQDSVYSKPENVTDWKLRAERQEDMQRQRFRLENFNEESKKLISRFPELKDEVSWLVKHINDKWETVEAMMGGLKKPDNDRRCQMGSREKVEHEVKCLRKWLRELDTKLKPLSFQCCWTKTELEMKTKEHMVLHRDIQAHSKIVSSVCKLCENADPSILLAARALERKYHEYYLRSLEWQFHIESLIGGQLNKSSSNLSNDSDGEPVAKIARITSNEDTENGYEGEDRKDNYEPVKSNEELLEENDWSMDTSSLVTKEPQQSLEELSSTTMVGAYTEKQEGIRSSAASTQDDSKFSSVGTKSKNANISFSCANCQPESRTNRAEKSQSSTCDALFETLSNGLDEKNLVRLRETSTAEGRQTNRSTRKPNTATFDCKHLDTDSDQEKVIMSERIGKEKRNSFEKESLDGKDVETTSSEESWMYLSAPQTEKSEAGVLEKPRAVIRLDFNESDLSKGDTNGKEIQYFTAKIIPRSNSVKMEKNKEPISSSNRKLVDRADELVRSKVKSWKTRSARSKKGRKEEGETKPLDSCDASEEYTTEDSDGIESQSSEDNEGSVATCRKFGSREGILEETPIAKAPFECVVRRQKQVSRNRPWSMSSVSWLRNPRSPNLKSRSSMPELALNQMVECCEKERSREFKNFTSSSKSNRGFWVETHHSCGNGGASRRKRTKVKKRMNKKSDSGSDVITLSGNDSPNRSSPSKQIHTGGIVKSGSFSGVVRRQRDFSPSFIKCDSLSGTETDEEPNHLNPPMFRLGSKDGAVTVATEQEKGQVEEQLSLNSDQVYWDPYQEKYQSEAYSEEPPDSDTAKKLLEFGEDYGKFLGNQSDCASSWNRSIAARNRKKFDSDSDADEVKKFLRRSIEQLDLSENKFNKTVTDLISTSSLKGEEEFTSKKNFFDEIIANCKGNVDCLTKLLDEVKGEMLLSKEHKDIQNVKESWENLKATAESHKAKQLRKEMSMLKEEFVNLASSVESMETRVTSREELEAKIIQVKNELNSMREGKNRLLQANVSVHRFLSTAKDPESSLRDEVTDLYQVWDQTFCRVSSQLLNLQSLSDAWYDFEDHFSQFQCALRTDTLKVLDFALKCGSPSPDVAVSFRDIAGLLSEKESTSKSSVVTKEEEATGDKIASPLLTALSTEGSLSDSGISDSGSEQELSEREKRLAQLKKLAKRLESILAPGSQALSNMFKRIERAEMELRELQKTCRDLIMRSASADEFKMIVANTASLGLPEMEPSTRPISKSSSGKLEKNPGHRKQAAKGVKGTTEAAGEDIEDYGGGKPGKKSWLWRLIRFSLPFQLALVALLCAACIMEPRCCDSLNNLDMSLNPQLRYDSGPPPV